MLDVEVLDTSAWIEPGAYGMEQCRRALSAYYNHAAAERWLVTPHGQLEGRTPAFAIGLGETDRVLTLIREQLSCGAWT